MRRTLETKDWNSTTKAKAPVTGLLSDIGFLWEVTSPETKGLGGNTPSNTRRGKKHPSGLLSDIGFLWVSSNVSGGPF